MLNLQEKFFKIRKDLKLDGIKIKFEKFVVILGFSSVKTETFGSVLFSHISQFSKITIFLIINKILIKNFFNLFFSIFKSLHQVRIFTPNEDFSRLRGQKNIFVVKCCP